MGFEVVYLPARPELRDVSSSMVRQLAAFGGDITPFVPECNAEIIRKGLHLVVPKGVKVV